jgi:multiple sugar transport system permease protein
MSIINERILGKQRSIGDILIQAGRILLLIGLFVVAVLPAVFALSMSVRNVSNFYAPIWIPKSPTLEWYAEGFSDIFPLMKNSYLRALGSTLLTLAISVPAGYAFARRDFAHKSKLFYSIVGVLLFPILIVAIPLTVLFFELGLQDSIPGLWIVDLILVVPFAVYLLRDYFADLPSNLEQAAQVYGCTSFSAFVRVILPLAMPGILAVSFFSFVIGWNEFFFAILITQSEAMPAIVSLNAAVSTEATLQQGVVMAQTVLISLPPVVLYLIARKSLTETF